MEMMTGVLDHYLQTLFLSGVSAQRWEVVGGRWWLLPQTSHDAPVSTGQAKLSQPRCQNPQVLLILLGRGKVQAGWAHLEPFTPSQAG